MKANSLICAIVITQNEAEKLPACLKSLDWVNEIIVVDSGSTDQTVSIARAAGAKVVPASTAKNYAAKRNLGRQHASSRWLFYVDADEQVPRKLKTEIVSIIKQPRTSTPLLSYKVPRRNIILGKWIRHGGFWPDYVHRLFAAPALDRWTGRLHETPRVNGEVSLLKNPLKHVAAQTISATLAKSNSWSEIEAQLLHAASAAPVVWWKIVKVFLVTFLRHWIIQQGYKDGFPGFALSYIRSFHQACVLVKLWQLQNPQPNT